jgi:hypothetical protein
VGKLARSSKLRRLKPSEKSISKAKSNTLVSSIPSSLPSTFEAPFLGSLYFLTPPSGLLTAYIVVMASAIPSSHWLFHWSLVAKLRLAFADGLGYGSSRIHLRSTLVLPLNGHRDELDGRILWLALFSFPFDKEDPLPIPFSACSTILCFGRWRWNDYIEKELWVSQLHALACSMDGSHCIWRLVLFVYILGSTAIHKSTYLPCDAIKY